MSYSRLANKLRKGDKPVGTRWVKGDIISVFIEHKTALDIAKKLRLKKHGLHRGFADFIGGKATGYGGAYPQEPKWNITVIPEWNKWEVVYRKRMHNKVSPFLPSPPGEQNE